MRHRVLIVAALIAAPAIAMVTAAPASARSLASQLRGHVCHNLANGNTYTFYRSGKYRYHSPGRGITATGTYKFHGGSYTVSVPGYGERSYDVRPAGKRREFYIGGQLSRC